MRDLDRIADLSPDRNGLPDGIEPFVSKAGHGERYETNQQINPYPVRSRNNGGSFFAMDTRGAKTGYIPLHFHQQHSENFFCLSGIVKIHANGQEIVLAPGDFLQAPAGAIHNFAHDANNTRMLGILNRPPVFEKFFEYMSDPTEAVVQQEGGEIYFPAERLGKTQAELDLVVVGTHPGAPGGHGDPPTHIITLAFPEGEAPSLHLYRGVAPLVHWWQQNTRVLPPPVHE